MRVKTVISNPTTPKSVVLTHKVPKTFKGRQVYSYTHLRAIYSLFGCGARQRIKQYNAECIKTLRSIPANYTVFSASQYAIAYGISHVTAKKRLKQQLAQPDSMLIQISPKYFVQCYDQQSYSFVLSVVQAYNCAKLPKYKVHLPNIFNALQKIQQADSAFYSALKKLVGQPVLTVLQHLGVLHRIQPDFMRCRTSLLYYNLNFSSNSTKK